jgi:hypothetical protein
MGDRHAGSDVVGSLADTRKQHDSHEAANADRYR